MKKRLWSMLLCLSLLAAVLAVPGVLPTTAGETDWQEGTNGVGQYAAIDQTGYTALGTSLIAGKTPTKKDGTAYSYTIDSSITDGRLSTNNDYAEFKSYYNQWAYLRFDLGAVYDIDNLVVGSPVRSDGNDSWTLRWFRVYVSDNAATLYDAANLVAQVDKVATKNAQLQVQPEGGKATGRYVGFEFWVPSVDGNWRTANPFNAQGDMYTLPNINYNNDGTNLAGQCWGALEIGELAVFGKEPVSWQEGTGGLGQYQAVEQSGVDALGNSLIAGMLPTKKDGTAYSYTIDSSITDGRLSTNNDYAEFKSYYNQWAYLRFDLGAAYDVDNLLVGSPVRSDGGKAWNLRWFRLYVSDDAATLFEDAHLVAQADKLSDAYAQVQIQPNGGKATGRYVGFAFWVPSVDGNWRTANPFNAQGDMYTLPNINYNNDGTNLAGQCWGALEIGELGVYGAKKASDKPQKQTVVCVGDSITAGVHYRESDTALANPLTYGAAYPAVLENLLDADENIDFTVVNAGIAGGAVVAPATADGTVSWLTAAEEKGYVQVADTVVLMLGSADAGNGWADRKAQYKQEYKKIIDAFKAKNADVNILLVTAPYSDGAAYAATLPQLVTLQKELANELGVRCVDMYTYTRLYVAKNGIGSLLDGADITLGVNLHPHLAGHRKIAELLYDEWKVSTPHRETVIGTQNDLTLLPDGANLLKGEAVDGKTVDYLIPERPSGSPLDKGVDLEQMTDGLYYGINTTEMNRGTYQDWANQGIVFDLRGDATITDLFVYAGAAEHYHTAYQEWAIPYLEMYVGDNPKTIVTAGQKVATVKLDGAFGKAVRLNQPVTARYVAFYAPGDENWGNIFLGELGVYGTYTGLIRPVNQQSLIAGMEPVDIYLAKPDDLSTPVTYNGVVFGEGDAAAMTDGDKDSRASVSLWNGIDSNAGVEFDTNINLDPRTPQEVVIYYMGGKAAIDTMSLTSFAPYTAGVDYYVGETLATLFDEENRVYTTNSHHTTVDEYERVVFDPAYDDERRTHTYDRFDTGAAAKVGRYVAFVVTRPYKSTGKGWYYARITELEVTGKQLEPDPVFDTSLLTMTDATTGITVTIKRLNNDDTDFFNNLGGLRVTKSALPADANTDTDMHWLAVDSQMYTLALVDKTGRVLSADEVGERYWMITFPTEAGYFQTMGMVKDGKVSRLKNTYTAADGKTVTAGSEYNNEAMVKGNNLSFVFMKYNSVEEIDRLNGYIGNDVPGVADTTVEETKGVAAETHRLVWPVVVTAAAVLLLAVSGVLCLRRMKGGE